MVVCSSPLWHVGTQTQAGVTNQAHLRKMAFLYIITVASVQPLLNASSQSAYHVAAFRRSRNDTLKIQAENQDAAERGFKWLWTADGAKQAAFVFQKWLICWDSDAQPSLGFTEIETKKKALLMSEENGQRGLRWWKGNSGSNNHLFPPRSAEYNLWTHNTSKLQTDGPQQQKPHWAATNQKLRLQFTQAYKNGTLRD